MRLAPSRAFLFGFGTVVLVSCQPTVTQSANNRAAYLDQYEAAHRAAEARQKARSTESEEPPAPPAPAPSGDGSGSAPAVASRPVPDEALRASCAQDRADRLKQRARAQERLAKEDRARAEGLRLAAYRKKHCLLHEGGTPIQGDTVTWDEEGYLRQTEGMGLEVFWTCPENGPVGARGRVSAGILVGGRGDTSRIARLQAPPPIVTRDDECRAADEEAAREAAP